MYYWYAHGEQRPVRSGGTTWWQMHSSVGPSWRAIRAKDYIKCNWISHYDYTHRWKWCIRITLRLLSYLVLISLKFVQKEMSLRFYSFLAVVFSLRLNWHVEYLWRGISSNLLQMEISFWNLFTAILPCMFIYGHVRQRSVNPRIIFTW